MVKYVFSLVVLLIACNCKAQWQSVSLGAAYVDYRVNDLYFFNDSIGIAAGYGDESFGGIFKTIDGGLNWTATLYSGYSIEAVEFISEDTGFAVGNNGRLYRITDQGDSWDLFQ